MENFKKFCRSQSNLQWIEHGITVGSLTFLALYLMKKGMKFSLDDALSFALKNVPGVQGVVDKKTENILFEMKKDIESKPLPEPRFDQLPEDNLERDEILKILENFRNVEISYNDGKAFAGIYSDSKSQHNIIGDAYKIFTDSNALYPDIFPGLRVMENDIIRMTANLLGGDENTVGCMTTGGTESIMLAIKACRDRARELFGITEPELIAPITAHPAFTKGCHYFNIKFVCLPINKNMQVDPSAVKSAITKNTILVVSSAPTYPHGVIDPIEEIGLICKDHNVAFHVDSCLGGFVLPWLVKLGLTTKKFDLSVPGVTSLSADLHKYGFGPKGAAVLLYKDPEYRKYQFYSTTHWSGGLYTSPSMTGSRSGGTIASAYAALLNMGQKNYMIAAKNMNTTLTNLKTKIPEIEGLFIMGDPDACSLAFSSDSFPILPVADEMNKKGWKIVNRLQKPFCLMIQIGWKDCFDVDLFVNDLKISVEYVKAHPETEKEGMAPLYGMAASIPVNSGIGEKILSGYLDLLYR